VNDRQQDIKAFLSRAGWSGADRSPLAGDASTRRYERLIGDQGSIVLMDAPPDAEAPTCPDGATDDDRIALGYNAIARLAGPDSGPFVAVSDWLYQLGLSAPQIVSSDLSKGLLLLEDLGDGLYTQMIDGGADEQLLYRTALDALVHLHSQSVPAALPVRDRADLIMKAYDALALQAEADLLIDWYWPLVFGQDADESVRQDYRQIWRGLAEEMAQDQSVLVLRDYHAQNLLWLPDREGLKRVGLIDFQDAVLGSPAYDLVSLLEDARRDVSPALADQMLDYYIKQRHAADPTFDESIFRAAYALFGAQRNAKIVGIFARLCVRDGKPNYLEYLPRVWRYLESDLNHTVLGTLKTWFDSHISPEVRHSIPKHEVK